MLGWSKVRIYDLGQTFLTRWHNKAASLLVIVEVSVGAVLGAFLMPAANARFSFSNVEQPSEVKPKPSASMKSQTRLWNIIIYRNDLFYC